MRVTKEVILALAVLLAPAVAQVPTPGNVLDMLDALPDINTTQIDNGTYMVHGDVETSAAKDYLNWLGDLPGVTRVQINSTAYTITLQPYTETAAALCDENHQYIRLDEKNDCLYANSNGIGNPQTMHLVDLGDDKVAIRGPNGKYAGFRTYTGETYFIDADNPECYVDSIEGAAVFKKIDRGEGRYEFQAPNGNYLSVGKGGVVEAADKSSNVFRLEVQDKPTLQEQINAIRPGGNIYLKEGVYKGTLTIDNPVRIFGAKSGRTFIDGVRQGSVFTVGKSSPNIDVGLYLLTIVNGLGENGGGIINFGRLDLYDVAIARCNASNSGGGVFNHGTMTCTTFGVSQCYADLGAGVFNDAGSDLTLAGVLIRQNTANVRGGGVYNRGNLRFDGGVVWGNEPDEIINEPPLQSAGDSVSPAGPQNDVACGANWWTCSSDSCKTLRGCTNCADDTMHAWSDANKACMGFQHACCSGSGNCKGLPKDSHGCDVCRCG
jgi:hypothetical protein